MITGAETAGLVGGRPSPIYLEGRLPLLLQAKDVMALGLRDGQMVKPTIEVRQEQLKMIAFNRVFDLPPGLRAQAGDVLSMQVQVLANGSAQLRVLMPNKAGSTKAAPADSTTLAAPASRVDQLSLRPPSGLSAWLKLFEPSLFQQVQAQLAPSAEAISAQRPFPRMGTLDGPALKLALLRSGLFTESRLLAGALDASQDLKLMMRDWMRRIAAHSPLSKMLSDAVDDIESAQLQALDGHSSREGLALVLGFADAPPVHLQIQREGGRQASPDAPWLVNIHSDSEQWGPLWLQVKVLAEQRVGLTMWAERETIYRSAQSRAESLAQEMREADLDLVAFRVIHGRRTDEPEAVPPQGRLVDFKA
jgi:hypothetical protein